MYVVAKNNSIVNFTNVNYQKNTVMTEEGPMGFADLKKDCPH